MQIHRQKRYAIHNLCFYSLFLIKYIVNRSFSTELSIWQVLLNNSLLSNHLLIKIMHGLLMEIFQNICHHHIIKRLKTCCLCFRQKKINRVDKHCTFEYQVDDLGVNSIVELCGRNRSSQYYFYRYLSLARKRTKRRLTLQPKNRY